jgi:hypothetical protein
MHNNKTIRRNMGERETIIFYLFTGDYHQTKPLFTVRDLFKIQKFHQND